MKISKAFTGFLFLMACVYAHVSWAQPANQLIPIKKDLAPSTSANTLLWKIEGNGIKTSYLFGTIHMLPQKDFELKEKVKKAFNASEQIVMELDMDDPGLQMEMMQQMNMKEGHTLKALMKEEDYKKLDGILTKSMGAGVQMFNTMKPFVISSMLIQNFIEGQMASFEQTFVAMAKEKNKEVLGLETATEQLSIFDRIPYKDQVEDLSEMLNEEEKMKAIFADMIKWYKEEDYNRLYEYTKDYMDDAHELELMLGARNRSWIPKIGKLAKEKTTFFGVGAAHLGGEIGVLALLKDAGYQVTPVH